MSPVIQHYATILNKVQMTEKGTLEYSNLECEYVGRAVTEGVRGALRLGDSRRQKIPVPGSFARSKLFYRVVPVDAPGRLGAAPYRFLLEVDCSDLEASPSILDKRLVPLGKRWTSWTEAEANAQPGGLLGYLVATITANYADDFGRACDLTGETVDAESSERLDAVLKARQFSLQRDPGGREYSFPTRRKLIAFLPLELEGSDVYESLVTIAERASR